MPSLIPAAYAGLASGLDSALEQRSIRLAYAAQPSAGTQSTLISSQLSAAPWQFLMLGDGSHGMSSAIAQAICANPNGAPITASTEAQRLNLATGLVTYFNNIPAAADGAACVGFAIGGLVCSGVTDASLVISRFDSSSSNPATILRNIQSVTPVGGPQTVQPGNYVQIQLDGSNHILEQDGVTAIAYGTNTLVICPAYGVIFGSFTVKKAADAPIALDYVELLVNFS